MFTDCFTYQVTEALTDLNDVKTNNYSNIFLGKNELITDWLQVNEKKEQHLNIVTTLNFQKSEDDDPEQLGIWLYFDKNYTFFDFKIDRVPYYLSHGRPEGSMIYSFFFYLEYISDTQCKIAHNFGEYTYYLGVNEKGSIEFMKDLTGDETLFNYALEGNLLRLYKKITTKSTTGDGDVSRFYTLGFKVDEEGGHILTLIEGLDDSLYSTIYINEIQNQLEYYLDNSWVGYDQKTAITAINLDKSAFHIKSQAMFHHQYNKDYGINFVQLKNNVSYNNSYTRGDNLTQSYDAYPDVNFRNYSGLHTGINQELGYDNVILTYNFTDQVFTLADGESYEWRIHSLDENNGRNPIWPFKMLNIKDSKFKKNGAMASDVPYFSDKVYKLQGRHTIVQDEEGNKLSPNNGTYLCTWLYQEDANNTTTWLDRYYYPDRTTRKEALTAPHFAESFENLIDKNYNYDAVDKLIKENTYFDKISDLVFEPDNEYRYSRISSATVNDVLEEMADYRIENVEDKNGELAYLSELMELNGKHHLRIDHDLFKKTNAINFNTDLYITNGKRIGVQLFGSDYTSGFNIQNRKDVAPYHYYATDKVIYILNNDFTIRHQFDLYSKYHDTINKFILGDVFDDIIAVSNLFLYIFSYDLSLKTKIYYADILGITDISIDGLKNNLLSYPYASVVCSMKYTGDTHVNLGKMTLQGINIGRLRDDTIRIRFNAEPAEYHFETNISKILSEQNAIIYKGNLYVPYNQDILKIIFVPDADRDNFSVEDVEKHPCKIRVLDYNEYYVNYQRTSSDNHSTLEPTLENEFIEVEDKFKHIYIDGYGNIYAFNFDKLAVSPDGDTVYGLYGWDKYIAAGGWYWLYNQSLSRMQAQITSSKFAEFGSEESIDFMKMNELAMTCIVRGFANMSDNRRFEVYDESKQRFYQWPLTDYSEIYSLDSYKYIDGDYSEHVSFVILAKLSNLDQLMRIEYQCDTGRLNEDEVDLPVNKLARFVETTNSNTIMRYANENKIYFNLYLPNIYLQNYHEQIVWDLTDIQTGWYNINVYINLDKAKFEVKINDIDFADCNDSLNFLPYVNSNGNIFDMTYYVGCLGKKYGTTMHRILYDEIEDRYACKDSRIENMKIYSKNLLYHEYQAMRMEGHKINPITITIPCGQRNNIEEIVRYFKYVPPTAISNKVKINISGTGLSTKGEFELLEKEIRRRLADEKDCLVDVEEIEFI